MKIICRILLLACLTALFAAPAASGQEKVRPQLAILPFTLNGAGDLSYLKAGVRTMLASRIGARAGVTVLGQGEVAKVVADQPGVDPARVAKTLGADLVLTGSITALGDSVSIDASLFTFATNDSASFFGVAENQSGIIGAVDRLASDITARISGAVPQTLPATKTNVAPQPSVTSVASPDQSLHPDRMFKMAGSAPVAIPVPGPVAVPWPTLAAGSAAATAVGAVSRSQSLDLEIQAMDVGDVFGEGSAQVVIAEKQQVTVFRQHGDKLVKGGMVPAAPRHVRIIALNLADLNNNGRAEIYISAISDNDPYSYAVEWDGASFVKLFDRQQHYLRPMLVPGKGWGLYGQQAGLASPVKPGIYKADQRTGKLLVADKLSLPVVANLFEFVLGDFTGDGHLETAVQSQDEKLYLYSSNGELLWQGSDEYGYTRRYIGPTVSTDDSDQENLIIPARLVALDLNGDGRQELVAFKNPVGGLETMIRTVSSFVGGSIEIMAWNGVAFSGLWSTNSIGSHVAAYQLDSAGSRLYVGLVTKGKGLFFTQMRSSVAGYGLSVTR